MTRTPFAYTAIIRLNNGEHIRRKIGFHSYGEELLKKVAIAYGCNKTSDFADAMRALRDWMFAYAYRLYNNRTVTGFAEIIDVEPHVEGFTIGGWSTVVGDNNTINETIASTLRLSHTLCAEELDRICVASWSDSVYESYSTVLWHSFVRNVFQYFVKPLPF